MLSTPSRSVYTALYTTPAAAAASTTRLHDTPGSFVTDTPIELDTAATTAAEAAGPRGRARLAHRLPPAPIFSKANSVVVASEQPGETHAVDESPPSLNATQAFPTTQFESADRSRFAPTWPNASGRADGHWQDTPEGTTAAARTPVVDTVLRLVSEQTAGSSPRVVAGVASASARQRDTHSGPVRNRIMRRRQNPQVCTL